ncbi:MAG: hypothetical protein IPK32_07820 [Verrucomicrobiaceae bacterium]|nr:hypothetical protein [Verrucomicrobiaceae bacterium]
MAQGHAECWGDCGAEGSRTSSSRRTRTNFLRASLLSLFALCSPLSAQERPADPAAHTVIVPYDAKKPLTQAPSRYYLGYEEFQRLWSLAKENRKPKPLAKDDATQHAVIHESLYDARIEENGLVLTARITAVTRGEWSKLALPFARLDEGKAALVGEVSVNAKAAALTDGVLTLEKPGVHAVALTVTLPMPKAWTELKMKLPPSAGGVLALHGGRSEGWPRINDKPALTAVDDAGGRVFTHPLGVHRELHIQRTVRGLEQASAEVPAASVEAKLHLAELAAPTWDALMMFEFPGATRRTLAFSLNDETMRLDDIRVLSSGQHAPMAQIETHLEPGRRHFTLHLQHEITGGAEVRRSGHSIQASPTDSKQASADGLKKSSGLPESAGNQFFDAPRPAARRISQRITLSHDGGFDLKPLPEATQQRVDSTATSSSFAFTGTAALRFESKAAAQQGAVDAGYVFQLSEQKAEILAALTVTRKRGVWQHLSVGLPEGYDVQAVQGPAVAAWQHEGRDLHVHFLPQTGAEARFVVHITRVVPQAVTEWRVEPLELRGFEKHTSKVLIVAHAAVEVRLPQLGTALQELDPAALDSVFGIAPPMEKKRALKVDAATWSTLATLARQPARFAAETVALVLASDAGIRVSQQLGLTVEQGALRSVSLTLPAALPEAVVSGPLLREMRSRVEGGLRIYDCSFQSDVLDATTLTFDLDLPLSAELSVPFCTVPSAGRVTRWFVLDNASAREAKITTQTALEAATREQVPYLPTGMARPQFLRATGDGTLTLAYTQLASTEGNAALVTLADVATHLRSDGQRWDVVTYSLINRSLQFLPVVLPDKAILIAVSVGGEPVRADEELRAGRRVRLIPLIHTRPGQRAVDVQLIYRFEAQNGSKLPDSLKLDDPELDGLSAERTTWTVWVPKSHQIADLDGNMDRTAQEIQELQKLEGMLSELGEANRVLSRADVAGAEAKNAYDSAKDLQKKIQLKKEATLSQIVSNGLSSLLSVKRYSGYGEKDAMDLEIEQQGRVLDDNFKSKEKAQAPVSGKDRNTAWGLNKSGAGKLEQQGTNTFSGVMSINGGQVFNDNLCVANTYFGGTTVNAGQLQIAGGSGITITAGNTITLSGAVSGTGSVALDNAVQAQRQSGQVMLGANTLNSTARGNAFNNAGGFVDLNQPAQLKANLSAAVPAPKPTEPPVAPQQGYFGKATGKHSLALTLPTGGEAHHFTKLKDHAVLELTLKPAPKANSTARWIALGAALLVWGLLARFTRRRG